MRPAKMLVSPSALALPGAKAALPKWEGRPDSTERALDYFHKKTQQTHEGFSASLDALALEALIRHSVAELNAQASHQPPVWKVSLRWGAADAFSGLKHVEVCFRDTLGRVHDKTWFASDWGTPLSELDAGLGSWPLDGRSPQLGGAWGPWLRAFAGVLPVTGDWDVIVPRVTSSD